MKMGGIFILVSIPSNGSIQFLPVLQRHGIKVSRQGLNPLKRVNSILTEKKMKEKELKGTESQSPQTGQFNSYAFVVFI